MAIIKAQTGRVTNNALLIEVKLLSSGVKLSLAAAKAMGLKGGKEEGDRINYATDGAKVFLYKGEGSKLSDKFVTVSNGLSNQLRALAALSNPDAATLEIKGGNQIVFDMSTTPVVEDGTEYFELSFKSIETVSEDEAAEVEETETKPKSKGTKAVAETVID